MRKIRQPSPTEGEDRLIPFLASLVAEDLSPKTVDGYRQDLLAFRRWYQESRGTDLRWEKLGSNDLINYRQAREKLVKRVGEFQVKSEIGPLTGYAYVTPFDAVHHMAVVYGKIGDGKNVLARLHRADIIRDVFGSANPVHAALHRLKREGRGVIVILRDGAAGVPTQAIPSADQNSDAARTKQWREVGLGAQILKDLGISSIRLLTSAKFTYVGLAGFGIEITDTETTEG